MTNRVKKITIIAASLLLTFTTMSFGFFQKEEANETIVLHAENEEDIPIIY